AWDVPDGRTSACAAELVAFLEGFAGQRPLIHFGHLLHLFYILRHGRTPTPRHDFGPLHRAYVAASRPARNAGALCAHLCPGVPAEPGAPSAGDLLCSLVVASRTTERRRPPPEDRP